MASSTVFRPVLLLVLLACAHFHDAHVSARITLAHSYPQPGNFSRVELRCHKDVFNLLRDAVFFRDGDTEITQDSVYEYSRSEDGVLTYSITPETEGALTCRRKYGGEISNALSLAGQPPAFYKCGNNDVDSVQYQLLPYSEGDTYTIPCTIKPGSLRNKYSIEWFQTSRTGFIQLPTSSINLMNFDLHLSSSELLPDRDLYCRVNIQHDSRIWNQRRYCGQKLRRAVRAELVSLVPHRTTVAAGKPANLTCTARGSATVFKWMFRGKTYSGANCRNGICVHVDSSNTSTLTTTSWLSISGLETTIAGDSTVTCLVTQDLPEQFNAVYLSSSGTLTVVGQAQTTETTPTPPETTTTTHTSPPDSTSDSTPSTSSSDTALNHQHIHRIITIIPIIFVVVFVSFLVFILVLCKRQSIRSCKRRRNSTNNNCNINSDSTNGGHVTSPEQKMTMVKELEPQPLCNGFNIYVPDPLVQQQISMSEAVEHRHDCHIVHSGDETKMTERCTASFERTVSIMSEHVTSPPTSCTDSAPQGVLPGGPLPLENLSNPSTPAQNDDTPCTVPLPSTEAPPGYTTSDCGDTTDGPPQCSAITTHEGPPPNLISTTDKDPLHVKHSRSPLAPLPLLTTCPPMGVRQMSKQPCHNSQSRKAPQQTFTFGTSTQPPQISSSSPSGPYSRLQLGSQPFTNRQRRRLSRCRNTTHQLANFPSYRPLPSPLLVGLHSQISDRRRYSVSNPRQVLVRGTSGTSASVQSLPAS